MNMRSLLSISFLILGLSTVLSPVSADQKRTFGFVGSVNSLDQGNRMMVIDDQVFRISESMRVYKKKGEKGKLSELRPGVKVGFYPGEGEGSGQDTYINAIWVLPDNWKADHGYADDLRLN